MKKFKQASDKWLQDNHFNTIYSSMTFNKIL